MEIYRDSPFSSAVFWSDLLEDLQDPNFLRFFADELKAMPEDRRVQILHMIEDQQTLREPELQESLAQMRREEGRTLTAQELEEMRNRALDSEEDASVD